ncbi:hypothetical protein [Streptomyces albidoflavus]|uniref:hypothetical protein n=1 Tax=Streptomyces albidoflavus TaxID=1886 RepID=UPI003D0D77A8
MFQYVVCAGSQAEADAWAEMHEVPLERCVYASSTRKIEGLLDFVVVRLRGFFGVPGQQAIEDCLRMNELKRRSPLTSRRGDGA